MKVTGCKPLCALNQPSRLGWFYAYETGKGGWGNVKVTVRALGPVIATLSLPLKVLLGSWIAVVMTRNPLSSHPELWDCGWLSDMDALVSAVVSQKGRFQQNQEP